VFSPTLETLCKAIDNGQLIGFPHITCTLVRKYLLDSTATTKGHLNRTRCGLQSFSLPQPEKMNNVSIACHRCVVHRTSQKTLSQLSFLHPQYTWIPNHQHREILPRTLQATHDRTRRHQQACRTGSNRHTEKLSTIGTNQSAPRLHRRTA